MNTSAQNKYPLISLTTADRSFNDHVRGVYVAKKTRWKEEKTWNDDGKGDAHKKFSAVHTARAKRARRACIRSPASFPWQQARVRF